MARTMKPVDLSTRTARARIKAREEPRWNSLVSGKVHLGYRRRVGEHAGKWILRTRRAGRYSLLGDRRRRRRARVRRRRDALVR
jgi:hypothetical protein